MTTESQPPLVAPELTRSSPPLDNNVLLIPTLPSVMSIKSETTTFNIQLAETEFFNNSVCETASVASDLTRMYVSDEDEKPEVLIRPIIDATPVSEERPVSTDIENPSAGKRPRVQFSPTF